MYIQRNKKDNLVSKGKDILSKDKSIIIIKLVIVKKPHLFDTACELMFYITDEIAPNTKIMDAVMIKIRLTSNLANL